MTFCAECKIGQLVQQRSEVKYEKWWCTVVVHDGFVVCTHCNCIFDLWNSDRYGASIAAAKQLSRKPIFLSCSEFTFLLGALTVYAGVSEKFAEFLNFKNFHQLKGLGIDFKRSFYEIDFDEVMCISPFFREATDLIAKKFGFKYFEGDLKVAVMSGEIVSVKLDKTVRQLMEMVEEIDYPLTLDELKGASYIIHVYY